MSFYIFAVLILTACSVSAEILSLGELKTLQHGVSGEVYAYNRTTFLVKKFKYDGAGPDAFFWIGKTDSVGTVGTILPYPFQGKFYDYEDRSAPIITGRFNGDRDIYLPLPSGMNIDDFKWMSVWCRAYSVNFGELYFSADKLEELSQAEPEAESEAESETKAESEPESKLPSPILPPRNELDDDHHDHDHYGDSDAEPESQAESEPESEPKYSSASVFYLSSLLSLGLTIIHWIH